MIVEVNYFIIQRDSIWKIDAFCWAKRVWRGSGGNTWEVTSEGFLRFCDNDKLFNLSRCFFIYII